MGGSSLCVWTGGYHRRVETKKRELLIAGITRAVDRYREEETINASRLELESSLFEALVWVHSLNEHLRTHYPDGMKSFDNHKGATTGGRLVDGLRFARNSYLHHSLVSVRKVDGIVFPVRFSMRAAPRLTWQPLSEAATSMRNSDEASRRYRQYLVHADVRESLEKGAAWLLLQASKD